MTSLKIHVHIHIAPISFVFFTLGFMGNPVYNWVIKKKKIYNLKKSPNMIIQKTWLLSVFERRHKL